MDLLLLALATEHLSRLITKDAVTAVLRYRRTGHLSVLRHPMGRHRARFAGGLTAPGLTTAAVSVHAAAKASDDLQLTYGILREQH